MSYRVVMTDGRHGESAQLLTIAEDEVRVLHIRRAVMDTASPETLYGP
jgi:hypothetical protein